MSLITGIANRFARMWRAGAAAPSDPTRRGMLSASLGAGTAIWSLSASDRSVIDHPGTAAPTDINTRMDIRAFGAKGDRTTDDLDAIRRAIAEANQTDQYPAGIFIPPGNYRRSDSIALPNHICLSGDGISSIFNSQNDHRFAKPILINASPNGLIAARLQNLSLYGGSHAIRLDAHQENADLRLHNIAMLMQGTANLEANKLLQTVKITNCIFGSAPYGIRVLGTGTNCMIATGSEWIDHSECAIQLRGADGLTIVGSRFEGGGRAGKYCLDIENASNVLFLGCFFENVHEFLGRFRHITGGVTFQSCHFSGTNLGGMTLHPFRWDAADTVLTFRDCVSVQPMPVQGTVILEGSNSGIVATDILQFGSSQSGRIVAQPRLLAPRKSRDLVVFSDPASADDWCLHGKLVFLSDAASAQPSEKVEFALTGRTGDTMLSANHSIALRLVRRPQQWIIVAESERQVSMSFGWTFAWDIQGSTYPTVRAPLTS